MRRYAEIAMLGMVLWVIACGVDDASPLGLGGINNEDPSDDPRDTDGNDPVDTQEQSGIGGTDGTGGGGGADTGTGGSTDTGTGDGGTDTGTGGGGGIDTGTGGGGADTGTGGGTDTGTGSCDGSNDCWGTCWGCALSGPCASAQGQCSASAACNALQSCLSPSCDSQSGAAWQTCYDNCVAQNFSGETLLRNVWACIYCTACVSDCASAGYDCGGTVDTDTGGSIDTGTGGGGGTDTDNLAPGQLPPGGLAIANVPMFVSVGFDDNAYSGLDGSGGTGGMKWATDFFQNLKNPDNTDARVTFFVTSVYIGSWMSESPTFVKQAWRQAYVDGHEIALHTHSHPHGGAYTVSQWENEISLCRNWLIKPFDPAEISHSPDDTKGIGAASSHLVGFRTPYLEYNDNTMTALRNLGVQYDTSIEEGSQWDQDGTNFFWPYTMDNGSPANPAIGSHPGLWQLPAYNVIVPPDSVAATYGIPTGLRTKLNGLQSWFSASTGKMVGFDYNWWVQFAMTKAEVLATLKYTLDLRLQGNRAPMLIGAHSDYYSSKYTAPPNADTRARQEAIEEFIQYARTKPEVRIVPYVDVMNWMKNPQPL